MKQRNMDMILDPETQTWTIRIWGTCFQMYLKQDWWWRYHWPKDNKKYFVTGTISVTSRVPLEFFPLTSISFMPCSFLAFPRMSLLTLYVIRPASQSRPKIQTKFWQRVHPSFSWTVLNVLWSSLPLHWIDRSGRDETHFLHDFCVWAPFSEEEDTLLRVFFLWDIFMSSILLRKNSHYLRIVNFDLLIAKLKHNPKLYCIEALGKQTDFQILATESLLRSCLANNKQASGHWHCSSCPLKVRIQSIDTLVR